MSRNQILKKRARDAHNKEMYSRHVELSSYNPSTAYDRIIRLTHRINELEADEDQRTYYDRLIHIRRMERDILAISEHMIKRCPPDMVECFKQRHQSALEGIQRCNERIK